LVGAILLVLWAFTGFAGLGISGHGLVALILGILATTGLASALMALSFFSDRNQTTNSTNGADRAIETDASEGI
jgi:ABC-type multidrug transport system permease subunit